MRQLPESGGINDFGEIVIYNPVDTIKIDVHLDRETVWLTQQQLSVLFGVDRTVIVRHIGNIYRSKELDEASTCAFLAQVQNEGGRQVKRVLNYYNLDMILSVGYRVNSRNATSFRQRSNSVLKEYLLRWYAINPRLEQLERRVTKTEEKIDFFVKTALPPVEGIFYDGQIFDAYEFASKLIRSAKVRIVLIDNYVDETVLTF
ncbi:MAG: virulence RhuM family protein [Bacteroidales bacterium]|nr:virulence RhuM family protein [Bacteroidales bacterium]